MSLFQHTWWTLDNIPSFISVSVLPILWRSLNFQIFIAVLMNVRIFWHSGGAQYSAKMLWHPGRHIVPTRRISILLKSRLHANRSLQVAWSYLEGLLAKASRLRAYCTSQCKLHNRSDYTGLYKNRQKMIAYFVNTTRTSYPDTEW